jgi:uncharacterized membrane protein
MAKAEITAIINKPIEEVFDFMANFENDPQWQTAVSEAKKISDGKIGVGSTFRYITQFLNKRIDTTGKITEYNPYSNMSYETISGNLSIKGIYTFEPTEKGTKVTKTVEANLTGFFKLAESMVIKRAKEKWKEDFDRLKKILET